MKQLFRYLIPAIILIGIFAGVAYKLRSNKKTAQERVYQFDKSEVVTFKNDSTVLASPNTVDDPLQLTGIFEPNRDTKISAELQGKINRVLVDAGSIVFQGQTLIQLDNSLLQLQLQSIDVQIQGFQADVNRYTILAKADAVQGVQLEKSELALKSAQIQRATVQEQINKTTIKAPFAGVVTAKLSEAGAFAAPGVPLLQIIDISKLKFTVNVPEKDLKYFQMGRIYTIVANAYPDTKLLGKVFMIGSKANVGNSFPVQFLVQNLKNQPLKAGMFGKITIQTKN
ncbi:MAG: efflux RND transporter periplasmic adaptor subunit [Saprospiraceae bacterium]|jgi:membrane fusion protein (multidrug efflux system)|nr:efflux RND transporter periplasmic adaptor subunit [Saprospiraceae bacterium]